MVEEDRVSGARVRTPQEDQVGLLDLLVAAGTSTRSEYGRQTDD
jgi:hypothetical protein